MYIYIFIRLVLDQVLWLILFLFYLNETSDLETHFCGPLATKKLFISLPKPIQISENVQHCGQRENCPVGENFCVYLAT